MGNLFVSKHKNIIICWILLALLSFIGWLLHPQLAQFITNPAANGGGYDFFHYYASVKALQDGVVNIYNPQFMKEYSAVLSEGKWAVFDNHPLPFYLLYLPFTQGNVADGYIKHAFWQFLLYATGLLLLCRNLLADSDKKIAWITWVLLTASNFSWGVWLDNFLLGQVGGLFFFCLAVTLICAWKKQDFLCGLALAIAVLLKLYPILLLVWLASKRCYKAIGYCLFSLALLSLSAGLQWGFFRFSQYIQFLFTEQSYQEVASNQSLMTIVNACLYDVSPIVIKLINVVLLAAIAIFLWHNGPKVQCAEIDNKQISDSANGNSTNNDKSDSHSNNSNETSNNAADRNAVNITDSSCSANFTLLALDYSTWILAMLMLSPLSWSHHHLVLLVPFLAIMAALHNGNLLTANSTVSKLLWLVLAVGCLLFIVDSETLHGIVGGILYVLFYMAFYYKLILLLMAVWEVLLVLIVRESRSAIHTK